MARFNKKKYIIIFHTNFLVKFFFLNSLYISYIFIIDDFDILSILYPYRYWKDKAVKDTFKFHEIVDFFCLIILNYWIIYVEAGRGAGAQSVAVNVTGFGFWVRFGSSSGNSRKWDIYLNVYFHFFALMSRFVWC